MIIYVKNAEESTKRFLELISEFGKVTENKITHKS